MEPSFSRRRFLRQASATALLAGGAPAILAHRAKAQAKTLRILRWKHFVPSYDSWFNDVYIKEWGEKNDTEVIVDNVGLGDLGGLAAAEAEAGQGHDLVLFLAPPPVYEDLVIDHREIYEECERRYGKAAEFARRSSYNPRTDKFYGVCAGYLPAVLTYRRDLWDAVGETPDSWDTVRKGGRKIKLLHEKPVGISLAPENNSNYGLRALMYAFGASVQDADGMPALKSSATLEALKFGKALYEEAMPNDVVLWNAASNNRFILAEDGCLTVDTLSIARAAENRQLPVDPHLKLAQLPEGPAGRIGPSFGLLTYIIWKFSRNVDGAKKFLVDYIGDFRHGFQASGFQNMPSFPGTVSDLANLVENDPHATDSGRYRILADIASLTTNVGDPGYANAAIDEIFAKGLIPIMFARVATDQQTAEDALDLASKEVGEIFDKWRAAGKI